MIRLADHYEDWPNRRCAQLLSTDVPLGAFLDRSREERHADPDRLSTILEGSHEDSLSSTPQIQGDQNELVSLAQYLLNDDPDLQEELVRTYADLDRYLEPEQSDLWEDVTDETHFQRIPLRYFKTHEFSDLHCPDFRETPEHKLDESVELDVGSTSPHIIQNQGDQIPN